MRVIYLAKQVCLFTSGISTYRWTFGTAGKPQASPMMRAWEAIPMAESRLECMHPLDRLAPKEALLNSVNR